MLVFCIVDERKNEVYALPHTGNQLPRCLQSFLCVNMCFFQLFYLFVVEFVSNDRVTAHLRHQKHHTLDFSIQFLLHLDEIHLHLLLQILQHFLVLLTTRPQNFSFIWKFLKVLLDLGKLVVNWMHFLVRYAHTATLSRFRWPRPYVFYPVL